MLRRGGGSWNVGDFAYFCKETSGPQIIRAAELRLRFTLSQAVTASVPPGEESLFRRALAVAMKFQPIMADDEKELQVLATALNPIVAAVA